MRRNEYKLEDIDTSLKETVAQWVAADAFRMRALERAMELDLPDWYIAAGFVRNMAWDKLHGFECLTPLDDIDLIYFDPDRITEQQEREIETHLKSIDPALPWSVKNQARMHLRNGDPPYRSTLDAMRYWVEVETAVGVRLTRGGQIEIVSPFGLESLFDKRITLNTVRGKQADFEQRLTQKNWLSIWPQLKVMR